jgi:stringent starvation protein B
MNNNKTLKPYLINAFYTWTMDNSTTPLIEVVYDIYNVLPNSVKQQSVLVLNIHPDATRDIVLGKNDLQFEAMFDGEEFKVTITYESIQKIFTKEDGYGLEFTVDYEKLKTNYLSNGGRKIIQKKHLTLITKED